MSHQNKVRNKRKARLHQLMENGESKPHFPWGVPGKSSHRTQLSLAEERARIRSIDERKIQKFRTKKKEKVHQKRRKIVLDDLHQS